MAWAPLASIAGAAAVLAGTWAGAADAWARAPASGGSADCCTRGASSDGSSRPGASRGGVGGDESSSEGKVVASRRCLALAAAMLRHRTHNLVFNGSRRRGPSSARLDPLLDLALLGSRRCGAGSARLHLLLALAVISSRGRDASSTCLELLLGRLRGLDPLLDLAFEASRRRGAGSTRHDLLLDLALNGSRDRDPSSTRLDLLLEGERGRETCLRGGGPRRRCDGEDRRLDPPGRRHSFIRLDLLLDLEDESGLARRLGLAPARRGAPPFRLGGALADVPAAEEAPALPFRLTHSPSYSMSRREATHPLNGLPWLPPAPVIRR